MDAKEAELVTEEFVARDDNYNLCVGGKGGWSYANGIRSVEERKQLGRKVLSSLSSEEMRRRASVRISNQRKNGTLINRYPNWSGKKHTLETRAAMSASHIGKHNGSKNSQFGSMWITDGSQSRKIKTVDTIPEGWYKGRRIKLS